MNVATTALVLGIFSLLRNLHAEGPAFPKFHPTPVGDGPVLIFKQPKQKSNELALYLFDPAIHESPQVLWQDRYHPNPDPLERLSDRLILIEFQDRLGLVDLPTGLVTPLLAGEEQNQLVATENKSIYFFQRTIPQTVKDLGIGLTRSKDQKTIVEKYFRPRDLLFRHEVGAGDVAKNVSPVVIEHLLQVTADGFLVITADQPQKVATIHRDGSLTAICDFNSQWVALMTTHAFSPKGDYLSLAVLGLEQDFHEERTLIVCDLKNNKVTFTEPDVPLGPCLFSGRSNFLEMTWRTDHIIQYSGPFSFAGSEEAKPRFADIAKQTRLDTATVSKLPSITLKEEPEREQKGKFELKFGEVYYPGEKTPIASVLDEDEVGVRDLAVDTKGQWAAFSERRDDQVYFVDGMNRTRKAIHPGWAHDFMWLEVETGK